MWHLQKTPEFTKWLNQLHEKKFTKLAELLSIVEELIDPLYFFHSKALGKGLFELKEQRFGLRVYYTFRHKNVILLLNGGDKTSQQEDIKKARRLMQRLKL